MNQDKKVIIAIPVYRDLREEEIIALSNNLSVLRQYPVVLVKPKGLNTKDLRKKYPQIGEIEVSDDWLGTKNGILGYNEMMTSPVFYSLFSDYEYLLICQTDVWIFRDDLMKWIDMGIDLVGAPWPNRNMYLHFPMKQDLQLKVKLKPANKNLHCQMFGRIGNGGFCLRKVELFKNLCIKYEQEIQLYNSLEDPLHNEDIFWALVPTELKLPTIEQAANFAFDRKLELCYKINNYTLPMAAHGYDRKHRKQFWSRFIPKEAFKKQ